MAQTCQRCRRTNPREANYCYFDGNVLAGRSSDVPADGSAMNLGTRPFSHPLVFPSGEACHNFQQLAEACHQDTALAADLLHQGHLETFLASQGRMDLAGVARASAKAADRQRGLDDFLGRLPFVLPAGRLQVEPLQVDLGTLRIGEERRFVLNLRNLGMRLVHGTASCDVPWLSLGDGAPCQSRLFQFTDHAVLPVHIVGDKLRAYQQPQETEIHLDTPNVSATVTVRVRVPVQPFPEGVLAGARPSPAPARQAAPRRRRSRSPGPGTPGCRSQQSRRLHAAPRPAGLAPTQWSAAKMRSGRDRWSCPPGARAGRSSRARWRRDFPG